MKKKILIAFAVAVLMLMSITGAAMADEPTEVNVTWDGSGWTGGSVVCGDDAVHTFNSVGDTNVGAFYSKDSNDNPYTYGVDSCVSWLDTAISGNGFAEFIVDRTDAKTSYGAAGQRSYTSVDIVDGFATLQNSSTTNYASMRDCNYGWNANDHITVTGSSSYFMQRFMSSEATDPLTWITGGNFVGLATYGAGDADLDCMNAEASQGRVRLGVGCGCYTNAQYNANGVGSLNLYAQADNEVTSALAPGVTGMTTFNFIATWVSGISVADYSTVAD